MTSPTPVDTAVQASVDGPAPPTSPLENPATIEVRDVAKTFRIPTHRIDSFKERVVHPFTRVEYRELRALRGISFDVHRGEFFGIVGRNGSGKSTLLKILASIYRADGGTVRMAGNPAPFIELGVGFNPELTARENVVLNGVMMGLTQREARRRLDEVLDFAELQEFVDLKLKNYSSGMSVRLAFSVMIQSDADMLLIDEVLAVGDAAFAQKCSDVFWDMREAGRTIVLVTHDMNAVQTYCHRAMLLHDGRLLYLGDPEEVGRRYLRLNFADDIEKTGEGEAVPDLHARVVDAWLENETGERVTNLEQEEPIRLHAIIEARADLVRPIFGLNCTTREGVYVFSFNRSLEVKQGREERLKPGERAHILGTIDNQLSPGRYFLNCWVARDRHTGDLALQALKLISFVVFGTKSTPGLVSVPGEVEAVPEDDGAGP